jgi:hypothetical protein
METIYVGKRETKMMLKLRKAILASSVIAVAAVALPAAASAATLYVGEHASTPGNSCTHTGYTSIQSAITAAAPDSTIDVCKGTYIEQLEVKKQVNLVGKETPIVKLPVAPENSKTACDEAINTATGGEDQDLVSICTSKTVTMTGMTLEAKWPAGGCSDSLYGIMVAGGATLNATNVKIDGAGVEGSGCQGGVGIEVGFGYNIDEVGTASLNKVTVENYQKNGITVDGAGSEASVTGTTVTGAGPINQGQNGIQVSRGAVASISNVTVANNECTAPQCGYTTQQNWEEDAAGVLFYLPGASSTVSNSKLNNNNIGVEYVSGSETLPATPQVTLTGDTVTGGYASVQLNQGKATLENDKLTGGRFGIDINSYLGEDNTYAPEAAATKDKVEGEEAAVQVESSLGTLPGRLTFKKGEILGSLNDEDPAFRIG